jgi:hypothetical protein
MFEKFKKNINGVFLCIYQNHKVSKLCREKLWSSNNPGIKKVTLEISKELHLN